MLNGINNLIKENLKSGNKDTVNALRLVKSELLNNEKTPKPRTEMEVVKSYAKRLKKSMDAYAKHPERLSAIETELKVVKRLLPEEVSQDVIQKEIDTQMTLASIGLATPHAGKIIGAIKKKLPNADGSLVAKLVTIAIKAEGKR